MLTKSIVCSILRPSALSASIFKMYGTERNARTPGQIERAPITLDAVIGYNEEKR